MLVLVRRTLLERISIRRISVQIEDKVKTKMRKRLWTSFLHFLWTLQPRACTTPRRTLWASALSKIWGKDVCTSLLGPCPFSS